MKEKISIILKDKKNHCKFGKIPNKIEINKQHFRDLFLITQGSKKNKKKLTL